MIQNRKEMLELLKQDGMNLRLASLDLQEDKELVLIAVQNNPYSIQFASKKLQKDEELLTYVTKNNAYYYHIVDERSGLRFNIPFLNKIDPTYYFSYVYYMKLKEQSEETFQKIINWD